MKSHVLGYPRIGANRELKKAVEGYWKKSVSSDFLEQEAKRLRIRNWQIQEKSGIDLISTNDFSLYDQVLDASLTLGVIPERFQEISKKNEYQNLYFAMARGLQNEEYDITALEMTKWFDTNYHYLVPEFEEGQKFEFFSKKIIEETKEAINLGLNVKPVLLSPVTYLWLGKVKKGICSKYNLLPKLLPVYKEIIEELKELGVKYIQVDEPILALELNDEIEHALIDFYAFLDNQFPEVNFICTAYFDDVLENLELINRLPIDGLHIDVTRGSGDQLSKLLQSEFVQKETFLSIGLVDGRNVWKNNISKSIRIVKEAIESLGKDRVWVASSCSLLHSPVDLDYENELDEDVKSWLSFAYQKLQEISLIKRLSDTPSGGDIDELEKNKSIIFSRINSSKIHKFHVKQRVSNIDFSYAQRKSKFPERKKLQTEALQLPLYPTTTIGSFPQTKTVRSKRRLFKNGELSLEDYTEFLQAETVASVKFQEEIGLDVLVHGEFERNDMVEYFGEKLEGFAFTKNGWVQSYGSRCVKPPIIYGDVERLAPMTLDWTLFAQNQTDKKVKGMLTGPVTILQWSFVRDDQPRKTTCEQLALAIRDEVRDLAQAGIQIIQIDEPAIREGLPLKKSQWENYLEWAINAFRISASNVKDDIQIHTHMCYSEFNDIIEAIANMDADVITIECSRSQMELLDVFSEFDYPNEIGPGVYDIHSPRVPSVNEIETLIKKAGNYIPKENIWVNPDCGLKTRDWPETKKALEVMVQAAQKLRVLNNVLV